MMVFLQIFYRNDDFPWIFSIFLREIRASYHFDATTSLRCEGDDEDPPIPGAGDAARRTVVDLVHGKGYATWLDKCLNVVSQTKLDQLSVRLVHLNVDQSMNVDELVNWSTSQQMYMNQSTLHELVNV